jgi:hypothetical protein
VTCGEGQIERSVWCRMDNGRVLASEYCGSNMPATKETCSMKPCPAWTTGLWSQVNNIFKMLYFIVFNFRFTIIADSLLNI